METEFFMEENPNFLTKKKNKKIKNISSESNFSLDSIINRVHVVLHTR